MGLASAAVLLATALSTPPAEQLALMRTRDGPHQAHMPPEGRTDVTQYCDKFSGVCADPAVPPDGFGPHALAASANLTAGTYFSAVFSNNAVLQREPEAASVYGAVFGATASTKVTVSMGGGGQGPQYDVSADVWAPGPAPGAVYWRAVLKPQAAGGSVTVSAACGGCQNTTTVAIANVTFGNVLFCSGQSNMWLPMMYSFTRNRTYALLDSREAYTNIRVLKQMTAAVPDGQELRFVPPSPRAYGKVWSGWWLANSTVIDDFSAACWYWGQEMVDAASRANNGTVFPDGLIVSAWGGTEIEMWQPNKTQCKTVAGKPIANRRQGNGAIYNGMIVPFLNTTIRAASWWQGENNVGECQGVNGTSGHGLKSVGPDACGSVLNGTGYACQMANLIKQWRVGWSATKGTTNPVFPFGLVTLADGTSEGHQATMAAFRRAQTGGYGHMPNPAMPNTFVALAHDAGDPGDPDDWGAHGAGCREASADFPYQMSYDARPMYQAHGVQYTTNYFMGPIHPRTKQSVGRRLAAAAFPLVYPGPDASRVVGGVVTGPLVSGCSVYPDGDRHMEGSYKLTIRFNASLLGPDVLHVWKPTSATQAQAIGVYMQCINVTVNGTLTMSNAGPCQFAGSPSSASVLEAQYNNTLWFPVALPTVGPPYFFPNGTRTPNADSMTTVVPRYLPGLAPARVPVQVTGLRYAWSAVPCCPGANRGGQPCPPGSCPITTYNTSLPAVPFMAKVTPEGSCECYAPQECGA